MKELDYLIDNIKELRDKCEKEMEKRDSYRLDYDCYVELREVCNEFIKKAIFVKNYIQ